MKRVRIAAVLASLMLAGCSNGNRDTVSGIVRGEGTMVQGVGDCPNVWGIRAAGRTYWPVEDPRFQRRGLRVTFWVRERKDFVSACMAGTGVDVLAIDER